MKTALLIHSYPGGNDTLLRNWPYLQRSGLDLFGVGRIGGGCLWPSGVKRTKEIGENGKVIGSNLCSRMSHTYRWFLEDEHFSGYTHAMIVEYDSIFLRPTPELEVTAAANLAGYTIPPMRSPTFYHCPWWLSREVAHKFAKTADQMIADGDYELGNPDFFFSHVCRRIGVPITHLEGTFSRNTVESESDFRLIREQKPWFVHGIKTAAQLNAIT